MATERYSFSLTTFNPSGKLVQIEYALAAVAAGAPSCDPSGAYLAWKATTMGKNFSNGKIFLEKRYSENLEFDGAVHTAIWTLKECFEGYMMADNIEVGICDPSGSKDQYVGFSKDQCLFGKTQQFFLVDE